MSESCFVEISKGANSLLKDVAYQLLIIVSLREDLELVQINSLDKFHHQVCAMLVLSVLFVPGVLSKSVVFYRIFRSKVSDQVDFTYHFLNETIPVVIKFNF